MPTDWEILIGSGGFSIAAAYLAYRGAVRRHLETTKDSDKSIYVAAITNERAKWRDELRKGVAKFCSLSIEKELNIPALQELKTDILLRLNPNAFDLPLAEKHKFDRKITLSVNAIFDAVHSSNREVIPDLVKELEGSTQGLLKQEWEVSKNEAHSGQRHVEVDTRPYNLGEWLIFPGRSRASEPSASSRIPLPVVLGGIGLLLTFAHPSSIGGGTAFLIGFACGIVLLFITGYYEARFARTLANSTSDSEVLEGKFGHDVREETEATKPDVHSYQRDATEAERGEPLT